jgi:hypothetical protein
MIHLDRPDADVRRLLRLLRHPYLLEREPLALRARNALGTASCRDALLLLVERAFGDIRDTQRLREIILRCDVEGQKARQAAAGMHLSLRQFFRHRAEAIEALALSFERLDEPGASDFLRSSAPAYCAMCHQRISAEARLRSSS